MHCPRAFSPVVLLPALLVACAAVAIVGCDKPAPERPTTTTPAASTASPTATSLPSGSASAAAPTEPAEPPKPLNVILLTLDAFRADHALWQGYERDNAPHLTKLAEQGVIYNRAYAVASYTAKAIGALLTSRYPSSLYRSGSFFEAYSDANLFFTELLQQADIRTMAGHSHKYYDRGKNLRQGFDVWRITPLRVVYR